MLLILKIFFPFLSLFFTSQLVNGSNLTSHTVGIMPAGLWKLQTNLLALHTYTLKYWQQIVASIGLQNDICLKIIVIIISETNSVTLWNYSNIIFNFFHLNDFSVMSCSLEKNTVVSMRFLHASLYILFMMEQTDAEYIGTNRHFLTELS